MGLGATEGLARRGGSDASGDWRRRMEGLMPALERVRVSYWCAAEGDGAAAGVGAGAGAMRGSMREAREH